MKWIAYLASLYVIILSGIPCQDTDACCTDQWEVTTTVHPKESEAGHKAFGVCSPFFVCGSCHLSIVTNHPTHLAKTLKLLVRPIYVYREISLQDFYYRIWQPPQLA